MNGYKKLITNQETRLKLLRILKFIPDKLMIEIQYLLKLGRKLNLKDPQRFTEKLQWYKINYRDNLLTIGADKYKVREYVESKGLHRILNKLYKVYSNPYEINVSDLPEKFVIKTNNGSGTNYFVKDKNFFDLPRIQEELNIWLNRDVYSTGREWSYKNIEPVIIVEELLEEDNNFEGINDYKILCFNGKPMYIILDVDRFNGHKRNIYDLNWNLLDVTTDKPNIKNDIPKPEGLEELVEVARILSEDFPFVRVDLYYVNKKIYFGELTFYPWTGYVEFNPDSFDFELGNKFVLPTKN
ncbi:ATP-grasp fold amidoligase family protein [Aerococcus sp. L_32]|uniref:ATP-grasp fold amidoligase family protein n=1 Tax=Aerococcus sp. L_32 TaxID=3422316 RepID=UPI003D6AC8F4